MTTPVGSIKFDLEIDGSHLSADIIREIQTALRPALAQLQRDLARTARESEKSGAKQAAAAKSVAEAVEDIGDEHTKTAAKAATAAGLSTRALNAQTRAVQKQTAAVLANAAAWDKVAMSQAAAAAAPQPAPPSRGGGAGGGGGGSGRGGRGGLLGGWSGSAIVNAGALGLGSFPAAATLVTNLTGAIQELIQVGLVAPGVIAGIGASFGTAKLGFQGMGDAIDALNEAAKSGDAKDLEKVAEALKDMDPAAVAVAKSVSKLTTGPLKDLQKMVAGEMFAGVDKSIDDLAAKTMPTLERGTAKVGSAWNKTFKEIGRVGELDSSQSFLDKIFGNTAEAQTRANAAIEPLIHGLGTLTAEGTDFLPRLADGLGKVTGRFDDWITKSAANGNLDKWIDQGITGVGQLGDTLLNIGKIITSITQAAGGDGGLLAALEGGTTKLAEFLASTEGQEKLTAFFTEGREQITQWIGVLKNVAGVFGDVYEASKQWTSFLLPILKFITGALDGMGGAVQGLVLGFLAFKTLSPFASLLGGLSKVDGLLGGINTKAKATGGLLGGGKGGLGLFGGALAIGGAVDQAQNGTGWGNALTTVGGAAIAGASVGGVPGAVIAAAAASIATAIKAVIDNQTAKARDENDGIRRQVEETAAPGSLGSTIMPPDTPERKKLWEKLYGGDPTDADTYKQTIGTPGSLLDLQSRAYVKEQIVSGELVIPGIDASNVDAELDKLLADVDGKLSAPVDLKVDADTDDAHQKIKAFLDAYKNSLVTVNVKPQVTSADGLILPGYTGNGLPGSAGGGGWWTGHADGGVLPGYSPGVDNMLVPMSGGEGVLIPEAVRGIGGAAALYAINSRFRSGLSRRGYAGGGIVGFNDGGVVPPGMSPMAADLASAMAPVVDLLSQILTALGGKASGDLATQIGDSTATALTGSTALTGAAGTSGMTGTEARIAKELAAGKVDLRMPWERAADDRAIAAERMGGSGGSALGGDFGKYAAALTAFAQSGSVSDVTGLGLDANDTVVKAIATARNKKKGALGTDAITGLIDQVLTGGGYTGVLDSSNTALIGALQTYREKLAKKGGVPLLTGGAALGLPGMVGGPKGSKDGLQPAASALWDVIAQKFPAVKDIGGVRDDPLPDHPSGRALDIMVGQNKELGDQINTFLRANAGPLGLDSTIWRDQWADMAGNTSTVGGHQDHVHALTAEGAAGGLAPGMSDPFASMATNMCGCVGDTVGGMSMLGGGSPGQPSPEMQALSGALTSAVNAVLPQVMTDALNAVMGKGDRPLPDKTASALDLIKEGNPAGLAAAIGYKVGDYNRTGGQGQADNLTVNDGPAFDARGAVYSDTAALVDRTLTSFEAANKARHQQLMDVMTQVRDQLVDIASKLATAAASAGTSAAGSAVGGIPKMATGGPIFGGTVGVDSVPIMAQHGEFVLNTRDVARMGGVAGVEQFRRAMASGRVRGFATGGGVNVNGTVGAEFFGVSQIPIIGMIVNILVKVLLAVLGVNIEARDTLNEMTDEFRGFRGEFKAFDSSGRLMNDTSALMDRSQSSKETAADERVRILKTVLEALIKYIIEKVIVPMAKAVANSLLQAAGSAVSSAMTGASMGMGGQIAGSALSSLITGVGGVGVDVIAELASSIATNLISTLIDGLGDTLLSYFPDLMTGLFGGGLIEQLIAGPIGALLAPVEAIFGALSGAVGGLFAPLMGMLGGIALFDDGGVAHGMGFMPKAVIAPERVLSPDQTRQYDRMLDIIERQSAGGGATRGNLTLNAPITVVGGGEQAAERAHDSLLSLLVN